MVKTYSKKKDGDKKLSKNFRVDEFACNDGSDAVKIDEDLIRILQTLRDHFKRSIVLNSGYRTPSYNARIGGATGSFHTKGQAADFNVSGWTPKEVRKEIESGNIKGINLNKIGLGAYPNFTHIDSRGYRGRW